MPNSDSAHEIPNSLHGGLNTPVGFASECPSCACRVEPDARFCSHCGTKLPRDRPADLSRIASFSRERRQITVLMCDLVDSTPIAERFEPEDSGSLLRRFQEFASEVVEAHGGVVVRHAGDALVAFFGSVKALEDDAERAVRAALGLVRDIPRLQVDLAVDLRVRVGVATGIGVVGGTIGIGIAREPEMAGPTPHLAARLQSYGAPGTVTISATTKRLVGDAFECAYLELAKLKGYDYPVPVWQVRRELSDSERFDAIRLRHALTPFVGREEQMQRIVRAWQSSRTGRGRVAVIVGEPGMGKTRLLHELEARIREPRTRILRYECAERFEFAPLYPLIEALRYDAGFLPTDSDATRLEKLESLLTQHTSGRELVRHLPRVAELLGLTESRDTSAVPESQELRKANLFASLSGLLGNLVRYRRTVVVVENLHWIDPTSLELLQSIVEQARDSRLLVLITTRPDESEARKRLSLGGDHVEVIELGGLDHPSARAVLESTSTPSRIPESAAQWILDRSDGNPLHLEEFAKWAVESGGVERQLWGAPGSGKGLPDTLELLLRARLDRCGRGVRVAQVGAVIGIEFADRMLRELPVLRDSDVPSAIAALVTAGIVIPRVTAEGPVYRFKHALLRDVAGRSLVREARRQLHSEIADAIHAKFRDIEETQPERLAEHYRDAGRVIEAAASFCKAARISIDRSANAEAIVHLKSVLSALETHPESRERDYWRLQAYTLMGPPLAALHGYASEEVEEACRSAETLMLQLNDDENRPAVRRGRLRVQLMQARYAQAKANAETSARLALDNGEHIRHADALRQMGLCLLYQGKFDAAYRHLTAQPLDFDAGKLREFESTSGIDFDLAYRGYAARALWAMGRPDEAKEEVERAIPLAEASTNSLARTQAHFMFALHHELRGEFEAALAWVEKTVASANLNQFPYWVALSEILIGVIDARSGGGRAAAGRIRDAITVYRQSGHRLGISQFFLWEADARKTCGDHREARKLLEAAKRHIRETGERYFEAEVHRMSGELSWAERGASARGEARASIDRALAIAQEQGALSWALRAAASLFRVLEGTPGASKARADLRAARAAVRGGIGTFDVVAAERLLS